MPTIGTNRWIRVDIVTQIISGTMAGMSDELLAAAASITLQSKLHMFNLI